MPHRFHALGLMSGSSLDGLDMALCRFDFSDDHRASPEWSILQAETAPFSSAWKERLHVLPRAGGLELVQADVDFGHYLGELASRFVEKLPLRPDLIASHGHTIFHYPERRLTLQIGDGAALAAATRCTVVNQFRSMDLALGGQGAPLAPLADRLLFPGFDFYLNLGGIANISARTGSGFVAFDIGGANQVLNALAATLGLEYDDDGRVAATGKLLPDLLARADNLPYFSQAYPKSLGNDWVQEQLLPLYLQHPSGAADKLHTACVQLARQTALAVANIIDLEGLTQHEYRMFVSGGGAYNGFLVRCLREECEKSCSLALTIPETEIVGFKEAALMALMGALRLLDRPNCLASATGAAFDAVGGAVHWGPSPG